jgi:protein TonB
LEATILSDGSVGEVRMLESSDTRYGFDDAAIEAVRQWRYAPATLDGGPVATTIEIVIEFN